MPTTITGPTHPLLARIRDGRRDGREYSDTARAILDHHNEHALSDESIYHVDSDRRWHLTGPAEEMRHLLGQPGYFAVTARTPVHDLARTVSPRRLRGSDDRAADLVTCVELAAPMVAVLLAACVRAELVQWDTTETVQAAAWRLSLDAGWRMLGRTDPALPTPSSIWDDVQDALDIEQRSASEYAAVYLRDRAELDQALTGDDIRWGGRMLTAAEAASRASVAGSTWRAYVTRGEAPAADADGHWRYATVDAWRLSRSAPAQTRWWSAPPDTTRSNSG